MSLRVATVAFAALALAGFDGARERIEIVASPSTYELSVAIGEQFAASEPFPEPRTQGIDDPLMAFCAGVGLTYPDAALVAGALGDSGQKLCRSRGVSPLPIELGVEGIVIARSAGMPSIALTRRQLFLAIAKDVPSVEGERLVANPYTQWNQIDASLPAIPIDILGPVAGSASAALLIEAALAEGARSYSSLGALEARDAGVFRTLVSNVRADPHFAWRQSQEEARARVAESAQSLVVLDLAEREAADGVEIDGARPSLANLQAGSYPLARPVLLVVKREHLGITPGLEEFLDQATSSDALGDGGYLRPLGLVPARQRPRLPTNLSAPGSG